MLCFVRSFAIGFALLGSFAAAQESRPDQPAPTPARITAKQAAVRCYATARSPLFLDTLEEGDVVQVGPAAGGFRPVILPLGPTGFVSKRYSTEPAEGLVKSKGKEVSFRYRVPKSAEVPVDRLADGVALHVLGEEADWWKVRSPATVAYVDEKDVAVLAGGDIAAAEAALKKTAERRQGEWTAALGAYESARVAAVAAAERKTKLDEIQQRFAGERSKPVEAQDYAPLQSDLAALEPTLPAGSDDLARCEIMKKELSRQAAVAEVLRHQGDQPVRQALNPEVRTPVDLLGQRATAIGWLRQRGGSGPGFAIERGGVVQFLVGCSSGRYDLTAFVGNELAISGSTDRPSRESIRVLDATKIEVLEPKSR
jgi:hypothetical protein